eukprot:1175693-Prorocentrum_minimum.AAC.1
MGEFGRFAGGFNSPADSSRTSNVRVAPYFPRDVGSFFVGSQTCLRLCSVADRLLPNRNRRRCLVRSVWCPRCCYARSGSALLLRS